MRSVAWALALMLVASAAASFTGIARTGSFRGAALQAITTSRPAIAAVRLMAEEDAEPEEAVEAEVVDEAAAKEAEEEEEEDLLSTPAFLKQKLKVLEKEYDEVLAQTAAAKVEADAQAEEWAQKRGRLQGDFDNFKARHQNQTLEAQLEARIKLMQEFLPVLDNFDRARDTINTEGPEQEATNAGYQQMHADLMATLAELGMEKIECVGQEFDYNLHMAIQQVPSDEFEENVVMSEMQPGYVCKGSLVRASYVMVSAG